MACLIWQRCWWGKLLPFESVTFLSSIFITLWWWYFWPTRSVANWTIWKNLVGPKFVPPSHSWQTFPAAREASKNGRSKLKTNRNGTVSENPADIHNDGRISETALSGIISAIKDSGSGSGSGSGSAGIGPSISLTMEELIAISLRKPHPGIGPFCGLL